MHTDATNGQRGTTTIIVWRAIIADRCTTGMTVMVIAWNAIAVTRDRYIPSFANCVVWTVKQFGAMSDSRLWNQVCTRNERPSFSVVNAVVYSQDIWMRQWTLSTCSRTRPITTLHILLLIYEGTHLGTPLTMRRPKKILRLLHDYSRFQYIEIVFKTVIKIFSTLLIIRF